MRHDGSLPFSSSYWLFYAEPYLGITKEKARRLKFQLHTVLCIYVAISEMLYIFFLLFKHTKNGVIMIFLGSERRDEFFYIWESHMSWECRLHSLCKVLVLLDARVNFPPILAMMHIMVESYILFWR